MNLQQALSFYPSALPPPQTPSPSSIRQRTVSIVRPPSTQSCDHASPPEAAITTGSTNNDNNDDAPPSSTQTTIGLEYDIEDPCLEQVSSSPSPSSLPYLSSDVTQNTDLPKATPITPGGESSVSVLAPTSINPPSTRVIDTTTTGDDVGVCQQIDPASLDENNDTASPSGQTHHPCASEIASSPLLSILQQQLTEATVCIQELRTELQTVKQELATVKQQNAFLSARQDNLDCNIRDNEAKFKHGLQAVDQSLRDYATSTEKTVEKLAREQSALSTQITKLALSKDTQLRTLKKQVESLLSPSMLVQAPGTNQSPPRSPSPSSFNNHPGVQIKSSAASNIATAQRVPSSSGTPASAASVATRNRFAVLTADEESDETTCGSSQEDKQTSPKATLAQPAKTPYDHLCNMSIRPDSNVLLLGDSIMKLVSERKMSSTDCSVQNLAVSGLSVEAFSKWLAHLPPTPRIRHVVFHVGINSCRVNQGPVASDTWLQLIRLVSAAFPRATIQASSIIPPFSSHHALSRPARLSNFNLKQACQQTNTQFVDHTSTFLTKNGAPKQVMYRRDNIMTHPSDEGTKLIALKIRYGDPPRSPHHQQRDAGGHSQQGGSNPLISRNGSRGGSQSLMSAAPGRLQSPPSTRQTSTSQLSQSPSSNLFGRQNLQVHQGPQLLSSDFPPLVPTGTGPIVPPVAAPPTNAWFQSQGAEINTSPDPQHLLRLLAQFLRSFV